MVELSCTVDNPAAPQVSFVCPAARDAQETGGRYGLLTAPVFDGDPSHVTCTPRP
jgi:hypothetical protein